jgi:hypothetical protein
MHLKTKCSVLKIIFLTVSKICGVVVVSSLLPCNAFSFPVLIEGDKLVPLLGTPRTNIIVIAAGESAVGEEQKPFKQILHQFDEVEEEAALVLRNPQVELSLRQEHPHPRKKDPFDGKLEDVHRLTLDDGDFKPCVGTCATRAFNEAKRLCGGNSSENPTVQRIDLKYRKVTAFVVGCIGSVKPMTKFPSIKIDMKNRVFKNELFSYKYKSKKNIFFDEVSMLPEEKPIVKNSELQVFLKPKFMFNMSFSEKDIISRITSITQGNLSTGVEVAFAMDVLSFKVNSQICCDVSVYKDALYFPVMLDLPFDGSSFKPGSGLYYGFDYSGDFKKDAKVYADQLSEYKFTDKKSQPKQSKGTSAILMKSENKLLGVGFRSSKSLATYSSAPKIAFPEDLKKIDFTEIKSKVGLFYDITTLAKGFHHFNVWFYAGNSGNEDIVSEYVKNGVEFNVSQVYN